MKKREEKIRLEEARIKQEEERLKQLEDERKKIEEEERQRMEEEMEKRVKERIRELEEERLRKEEEEKKRMEEEARQQSALELIEEEEPISPTNPNRLSVFSRELVSLCGEVRKINNSLKKEELQKAGVLCELDEEEDSDLVRIVDIIHSIVIIY